MFASVTLSNHIHSYHHASIYPTLLVIIHNNHLFHYCDSPYSKLLSVIISIKTVHKAFISKTTNKKQIATMKDHVWIQNQSHGISTTITLKRYQFLEKEISVDKKRV